MVIIIIISLIVFALAHFLASLTGESLEALIFTIPILSFTFLGLSAEIYKRKKSNKRAQKAIYLSILLIFIGMVSNSIFTIFLEYSKGTDLRKNFGVIFQYFIYLTTVFVFTSRYPLKKSKA